MKKYNTYLIILLISLSQVSWGQIMKEVPPSERAQKSASLKVLQLEKPKYLELEPLTLRNTQTRLTLKTLDHNLLSDIYFSIKEIDNFKRPIWVEGFISKSSQTLKAPMDVKAHHLLNKILPHYEDDFVITEQNQDEKDIYHARFQQYAHSLPIYGGDSRMHIYSDGSFIFNGRTFQASEDLTTEPSFSVGDIVNFTIQDLILSDEKVIPHNEWDNENYGAQFTSTLLWWPFEEEGQLKLCYHVVAQANYLKVWNYFVCAQTGEVIYKFNINGFVPDYLKNNLNSMTAKNGKFNAYIHPNVSLMDGPRTATSRDMDNINVTINSYQLGNEYYLIDASHEMYVNNSIQQGDPKGVAHVFSANNTTPYNNTLQLFYLKSPNNMWTDPVAVSAQNHTTISYKYLKERLNRNSLDNKGLNLETVIHYTDDKGRPEENAFWHPGKNQIFLGGAPGGQVLIRNAAGALDVVGHEYGHGVVEYTAKLIYRNQSGAVNETYADIFGSMIEGRNWQLGEDVINRNNFRTGALRDMSNPKNGGNSLNDNGYQPDHVNVMYTGREDYGGVHINSGIGNFAYFKIATKTSKDIALNMFYRALTTYLTSSSEFIDFRKSVIRSAIDIHGEGQIVNIVRQAFNEVGIVDGQSEGTEEDIETNPGQDYIVLSDVDLSALYLANGDGDIITNPFSTTAPISKLSFTDNGQFGVFVGDDNKVHLISIDYESNTYSESTLLDSPLYRNAAISKDGSLLAVLAKELDNKIYVYSFLREQWQDFSLYNYFTGPNSPKVDNVLFADVLEFSYDGGYILYDALNDYGQDKETWDISFIEVWDEESNSFSFGDVVKLFNTLDSDFNIGNPTFSKNSPYIIAFDFLNEVTEDHIIYGLNLERQELDIIVENSQWGYPSYSRNDDKIIFDAQTSTGKDVLAIIDLNSDKISSNGQGRVFIDGGSWGTWFSNGSRLLSSTKDDVSRDLFSIQPNPVADELVVSFIESITNQESSLEIRNIQGHIMIQKSIEPSTQKLSIRVTDWPKGLYFVSILNDRSNGVQKFVKID